MRVTARQVAGFLRYELRDVRNSLLGRWRRYGLLRNIQAPGSGVARSAMFVTDDASEILLAPQSFIGSHVSVCVLNGGSLRVERNARINEFNNIRTVGGRIVIGENVLIAQFVSLIADNHRIPPRDQDIAVAGHDPGKTGITIGPGAWIGSNVVVLPGVEIGQGAVIGAGSVVTTSIPAYAVAAGNPARVIRYRE